MKKIYTIRDAFQQRDYMWDDRFIEEEVSACSKRKIVDHFFKYLPKEEPILEAGCGLGAWVVYLSERGYNVTGIDYNDKIIGRLKAWRPSLNVEGGDIRNIPYNDGYFGAIISLGVMEHFEEGPEDALREAYRVLRQGGLFFFSVPMENVFRKIVAHPLRSLYLLQRRLKGDSVHFVEYRYNRKEVEYLLNMHGFEPIFLDWDDFVDNKMSLGIWADFPQLHGAGLYELNLFGKVAAFTLNLLSRWAATAAIFCLARKKA